MEELKYSAGIVSKGFWFQEFKKWVLKDVELGPKAIVENNIYWY